MGLKPRRLILTGHTVSSDNFLIANLLYKSEFRMALFKSGTLQKPWTNIENIPKSMTLEMVLEISPRPKSSNYRNVLINKSTNENLSLKVFMNFTRIFKLQISKFCQKFLHAYLQKSSFTKLTIISSNNSDFGGSRTDHGQT